MEHNSLRRKLQQRSDLLILAELTGGPGFSFAPIERFLTACQEAAQGPRAVLPKGFDFAAIALPQNPGGVANIDPAAVINFLFGLLLVSWTSGRPSVITMLFPPIAYYACLVLFLVGTPFAVYMSFVLVQAVGKPQLWWAALLSPLYWLLQSVAALKAFYQLFFRPFYWEKTVHGLSAPTAVPAAEKGAAR